ncbi:DUF4239 domain-containing protein [Longispora albida]|uniref:bestrophin-like domain n=1 Tax=Longispora albida TaxID=203523 RepID=UPI00035D09DA|nr:DUF4239 domain-containing protein [Longispora albida]
MLSSSLLVMFLGAVVVVAVSHLLSRRQEGEPIAMPKGVEMAVGAVSGLFVFSFAFLAVNAVGELNAARKASLTEASALKDTYFAAQGLAQADRDRVRGEVVAYTRSVIDAEWPAMRDRRASEPTVRQLDGLRLHVYQMQADGEPARAAKAETTARLRDVYVARRDRLAQKDAQVPPPILALMVGAGLVTLTVITLVGRPATLLHYGLLAIGAAGVAYMIFLVLQINHPYSGGVSLKPDAYREALVRYEQIGR